MNDKLDFSTLPRVVAIVGSRRFGRPEWVEAFVNRLNPSTIVVSGGARGVDTYAEEAVAKRHDLYFKPFYIEDFEWRLLGKGVGFARNEHIVRYLKRYGGIMIIFAALDANGQLKGGSKNDRDLCEQLGVPYLLYTLAEEENERLYLLRERRKSYTD